MKIKNNFLKKNTKNYVVLGLLIAVFCLIPTLKAGANQAGSITITSISPNPADTSVTISGTAVGGLTIVNPCGSAYYTQVTGGTANIPSVSGDPGFVGSINLTNTQTGDSPVTCPNDANGDEWDYSFSFSVDTSSFVNGVHTVTVSARDMATGTITSSASFTVTHSTFNSLNVSLSTDQNTLTYSGKTGGWPGTNNGGGCTAQNGAQGQTYSTGVISDEGYVITNSGGSSVLSQSSTAGYTLSNSGTAGGCNVRGTDSSYTFGGTVNVSSLVNGTYTMTQSASDDASGLVHPLSATFTISRVATYTVSTSAGTGGTISPGSATVSNGSSTSFTVTPNSGYSIASVSGCSGSGTSTYTTGAITGACTVTATFNQLSGTLTPTPTSCAITAGGNSCNVSMTWNTTYPIGTSSIVSSYPSANTILSTGNSGTNVSINIPYASSPRILYLYNNSILLAQSTATASCAANTTWNSGNGTCAWNTFSLTANNTAGGSLTPAGITTVSYGSSQTYTITPNVGYSIASVLVDGANQGAISSYTFSNVTANHTISATFNLNTYTVTPSIASGVGTISPSTAQTVNYGATTSFTITPGSGYSISSVNGCSGSGTSTYTTGAITGNCTVTATFSANPINGVCATTHYNCSAGTGGSDSFTSPSWNWYCNGVNGGSNSAQCSETIPPVTNLTFTCPSPGTTGYSSWTLPSGYTLSYFRINDVTANTTTSWIPETTADTGPSTTFSTTPGHVYSIWAHTRASDNSWSNPVYVNNVTCAQLSGTISTSPASCTIAAGAGSCNTTVTWSTTNPVGTSAVTASGMTNVNGNSGSQAMAVPYNSRTFYLYNNSILLGQSTATSSCATGTTWNGSSCATNTYTVSVASSPSAGGTVYGNGTYNYGTVVNITAAPNPGYSLSSLSGCGSSSGTTPYPTPPLTASCTVTGTFTLNSYTVSTSAGTGGTISPSSTSVAYGSTTSFTVTPNSGYSIASVSGCSGSGTSTYTTGAITGACTVTATFSQMSGTISTSPASCTIAAGAGSCNTTVTWSTTNPVGTSAVTASGMTNVNGNSGSQAMAVPYNSRTFYLYNNSILLGQSTATSSCATGTTWNGSSCATNTYTVSVASSPSAGGTVYGNGTYNYGTVVNITAAPNPGYSLSSLSGCGSSSGTTPYPTPPLTASCTVTGTFTANPVNGVCASTHYNCSAGTSVNNSSVSPGWTWNCNGLNGGTNSAQCSETIPPVTNLVFTCPAPGTTGTSSWTLPSGYTLSYFRIEDNTTSTETNWIPETTADTGPSTTFPTTAGHVYSIWAHTRASDGNWSNPVYVNNVTCTPAMTGTLTPAPTSCTIASGASSCNVSMTWSTTNPVGTSSITSSYPSAGTTLSTGNSGTNVAIAIPYASSPRILYLYNNAVLLAQSTATASCTSGTAWSGSACTPGGTMTGTLTPAPTSCTIASGASSCNVSMTWSTTNPVGTSSITSSYPSAGTTLSTGNSGTNVAIAIPYASSPRILYLYNNAVLLAQSTATASCTGGTGWGGSSCVANANGVCGTANGKTYPYNSPGYGSDTICASGTPNPSVVSFPAPGGSTFWQCLHVNSGTDATCSASQYGPPVLTATPATIAKGASSKLTWTSSAATCTSSGFSTGNLANSTGGGVTVSPTVTTTYSITCSDGGISSAPVTVTVKIKPKFIEK